MIVAAEVVDLSTDSVKDSDTFFVDTNVWLWMTYSRASHDASHYQLTIYPKYVKAALEVKAQMHHCGLTLAEIAHVIERIEYELYDSAAREYGGATKGKKELRRELKHRSSVTSEISLAWQQVGKMSRLLDINLNTATTDSALKRLTSTTLDAYDALMLEAASGCPQVITDDADFCSVSGIRVFTGNALALKAAAFYGKLVKR